MTEVTIGNVVKVSHPVTVLNPDEYFRIEEIRHDIADERTWIRGASTCWFSTKMIVDVKEK